MSDNKRIEHEQRSDKKRKKRKRRRRIIFILIPLLLIAAAGSYATYLYVSAKSSLSASYEDDGQTKSELREEAVDPTEDNVSVLIAGVDASLKRGNGGDARTDTLMLATLNKPEKSVKMLSIPRDSLVYIPELGYKDKINHAHAKGSGMSTTRGTVENLLDIPVDYYVKVNFEAFIEVVNSLDGITYDVPFEINEQNSNDQANAIHLEPGKQKLNGEEALALARTRKYDNDIERGKRQQEIIKAILDKSISMSSILKIDNIIEAVASNMKTNMSPDEMKSFISYGTAGKDLDIESYTLDGENYMPNGTYYWQLDDQDVAEKSRMLKRHLDLPTSTDSPNNTETPDVENNETPPSSEDSDQYYDR